VEKRGIKYQISDLLVVSKLPTFSKIETIIKIKNQIFFLLSQYDTISYLNYMACYLIKENGSPYKIVKFNDISNHWPLDLYKYKSDYLVIPKYPI